MAAGRNTSRIRRACKRNARDGIPVAVAGVGEWLRALARLRARSRHRRVVTGGTELVPSCCRTAGDDCFAWRVRGAGSGGNAALHNCQADERQAHERQAHDRRGAKAHALDTPPHLPSVRHRVLLEGMLGSLVLVQVLVARWERPRLRRAVPRSRNHAPAPSCGMPKAHNGRHERAAQITSTRGTEIWSHCNTGQAPLEIGSQLQKLMKHEELAPRRSGRNYLQQRCRAIGMPEGSEANPLCGARMCPAPDDAVSASWGWGPCASAKRRRAVGPRSDSLGRGGGLRQLTIDPISSGISAGECGFRGNEEWSKVGATGVRWSAAGRPPAHGAGG